ncbi:MAG: cell division protein FtsQ/DivIB [Hyphomicrobiales bacterium]
MQSLIRRMVGRPAFKAEQLVLDFSFLERTLSAEKTILPPLLRKPVRVLARMQIHVPEWLGKKAVISLLSATALYGLVIGGHADSLVGEATALIGLKVDEVKITGQIETSESEIIRALDLQSHASMVLFNASAARARIQSMPWIDEVTIRKTYPGSVDVAIKERQPFALWQSGQIVSVIDPDGHIITGFSDPKFAGLVLLVGEGADTSGPAFMETLSKYKIIESRVRAAVLVAGRRWNLVLENGIEVKLPEADAEKALSLLAEMEARDELLDKDIRAVDLRIAGQMAVRLQDTAMEDRQKAFEKRVKDLKAGAI